MGSASDTKTMEWPPTPEQAERIGWGMTLLFFLTGTTFLVGELLGWWNDLGEVGMVGGYVATAFAAGVTALFSAGRRQVGSVQAGVDEANQKLTLLRPIDARLTSMDGKLDKLDQLDDLDVIQTQLDKQTGVMDRQVRILAEIRDRL